MEPEYPVHQKWIKRIRPHPAAGCSWCRLGPHQYVDVVYVCITCRAEVCQNCAYHAQHELPSGEQGVVHVLDVQRVDWSNYADFTGMGPAYPDNFFALEVVAPAYPEGYLDGSGAEDAPNPDSGTGSGGADVGGGSEVGSPGGLTEDKGSVDGDSESSGDVKAGGEP